MRDLFDDFLEELRRREAVARGEDPDAGAPKRAKRVGPDDDPDGPDDEPRDDDDASTDDRDPDRPAAPHEASPPRRPRAMTGDGGRRRGRRVGMWVIAAVVIALFALFSFGLDLWTDALWYRSVGFDSVFWTRLTAQAGLFILILVLSLGIFLGNLWLAGRLMPPPEAGRGGGSMRSLFERINEAAQAADPDRRRRGGGSWRGDEPRPITFDTDDIPDLTPIASMILIAVSILIALTIAASVAASWETVLLWANRVPFSPDTASAVTDPVFGRDIGYFLFELPFLRFVQAVFNGIVVATLVFVLARYLVGASRGSLVFTTPVRIHLAVLGGLFLLSVAFGYQLDKFELAYSNRGIVTGVGFTDQNAQFFAYDVLTVVSGLAAAFLVGAAFTRMIWPLGLTVGVWILASLIIGRVYPEAVQRFTVQPNQYAQEERYIQNNIGMTRLAYGIDQWEDNRPFGGEDVLTQDAIEAEADTFRNARLWDYRPLGDTLDQLQRIRRYYDFYDVDTDRYVIDGVQRQVMLSARELDLEQNAGATGFVNRRIVYTHGIGAAMVPVNEVANEGQPRLLIRNLPPVSTDGAPEITEPRIYFGETSSDYVVTGARQDEFDYPTGEGETAEDSGTTTRWTGTTGIKLDTMLPRLLFALRFRDLDLLISDQVTGESQLLFHRSLQDRLDHIAPFLRYDWDPYLVIDDAGRLTYVQDAYTTSDRFPHAQGFDPTTLERTNLGGSPFNYIRNSVKITMDAYDGTMRFYVADPSDPIIRAYQGVFPTMFQPLDQMPADLLPHLRVPEELFNVQTRVFGRYHVTNPLRFFQNDDLWTVPAAQGSEASLPNEAYYVVMRMPGEDAAEFLLLQPMVPLNRPNMIAWVAARMDAPNYGVTRVYRFPADTTIFGPAQIEARIVQDPQISQQFTLWSQGGSTVIQGNLIVVPVGDSLIYLQPVYLQSQQSAFPEFQRIIVASPREVVWSETLGEALELLLEAEGTAAPSPTPTPARDRPRRRAGRRRRHPIRTIRCRPTSPASSSTRTSTSIWPRLPPERATSRRTGARWTRSPPRWRDSRNWRRSSACRHRGRRQAPRREPRGDARRLVPRDARPAVDVAARDARVPGPWRDPRRPPPHRGDPERRRPGEPARADDRVVRVRRASRSRSCCSWLPSSWPRSSCWSVAGCSPRSPRRSSCGSWQRTRRRWRASPTPASPMSCPSRPRMTAQRRPRRRQARQPAAIEIAAAAAASRSRSASSRRGSSPTCRSSRSWHGARSGWSPRPTASSPTHPMSGCRSSSVSWVPSPTSSCCSSSPGSSARSSAAWQPATSCSPGPASFAP